MRNAAEQDAQLQQTCISNWVTCIKEEIKEREMEKHSREMEEKFKAMAQSQADTAKSVMARMNGSASDDLITICIQSWQSCIAEEKKAREVEARQREGEQRLAEYAKQKAGTAQGVLQRMTQGRDDALVAEVFEIWLDILKEEKMAHLAENAKALEEARFKAKADANAKNALGFVDRMNGQQAMSLNLRVFMYWQTYVALTQMERRFERQLEEERQRQIDERRNQMLTVMTRFKDFAEAMEGPGWEQPLRGSPPQRGNNSRQGSRGGGLRRGEPNTQSLPHLDNSWGRPNSRGQGMMGSSASGSEPRGNVGGWRSPYDMGQSSSSGTAWRTPPVQRRPSPRAMLQTGALDLDHSIPSDNWMGNDEAAAIQQMMQSGKL